MRRGALRRAIVTPHCDVRPEVAERQVVHDAHAEREPLRRAIFGEQADALSEPSPRAPPAISGAAHANRPAARGIEPEQSTQRSVRPAPSSPASPNISPRRKLKLTPGADSTMSPRLEHHLAGLGGTAGTYVFDGSAGHLFDQLAGSRVRRVPVATERPIAQDRVTIGGRAAPLPGSD